MTLPAHGVDREQIFARFDEMAVDDVEESLAQLQAHGGELVGELVNYENIYWLCYVRGPAGIIVELAQKIG